MGAIQNIDIKTYRRFLESHGLKHIRDNGGHEIWSKPSLLRPVTFQTHIEPVPEFIVKNNLRIMGCTKKELEQFLSQKLFSAKQLQV